VPAQEALEVAVLGVLEHDADRVVGEADAHQPSDVGVVQTRHDARLALKILSGLHDTQNVTDVKAPKKFVKS